MKIDLGLTSQKETYWKNCNISGNEPFGVIFNLVGQEFLVIFILDGIGQAQDNGVLNQAKESSKVAENGPVVHSFQVSCGWPSRP